MKKFRRFAVCLLIALLSLTLSAAIVACAEKEDLVTLTYVNTIPEGRSEADVSGEVPAAVTVKVGTEVTLSDNGTLVVRGCRFGGWSDGTALYAAGDTLTLNSDLTLHATWSLGLKSRTGEDYLFIDGDKLVFTYRGDEVTLDYRAGQEEYHFLIEEGQNIGEYRLLVDERAGEFEVQRWGLRVEQRILLDPYDGTINFERVFSFDGNGVVNVVGYSLSDQGTLWATGTFTALPGGEEYQLIITRDDSYLGIPNYRFKMGETVLRVESGTTYAYNTLIVYDEALEGEYEGDGYTLSLDGYGYATLTEGSSVTKGVVRRYASELTSDLTLDLIDFKDAATGVVTTYEITHGDKDTVATIGSEVGNYQIWDAAEKILGRQRMILDGHGRVSVLYGETSFAVRMEAAYGTYELQAGGEYLLTITEVLVEDVLPDYFATGMRFILSTLSDGYDTPVFLVYTERLVVVYTGENGATITLDGYGNAVYEADGIRYEGEVYVDEENGLLTIARSEYDYLVFKVDVAAGTFRFVGQEIGTYFLYVQSAGLDPDSALYLDGEGIATLLVYDEEECRFVESKTGTYAPAGENRWKLTVDGKTEDIAAETLPFGYDEDWNPVYYPVYIVYDAAWGGSYQTTDGKQTLELDGYGLEGVYTDAGGGRHRGQFLVEANLVMLSEDDGTVWGFLLSGSNFSLVNTRTNVGIYYRYYPDADTINDGTRIVLDGEGNATYITGRGKDALSVTGTVENLGNDIYRFTPETGEVISFRLDERRTYGVFIPYDELWAGTFDVPGGGRLVLDGYGNALYTAPSGTRYESACLVEGSDGSLVVFTDDYNNFRFLLNRDGETAIMLTASDVQGYYYYYENDFIFATIRLFLGRNNYAEIARYNEETFTYEVVSTGEYAPMEGTDDQYTFTPDGPDDSPFAFKLRVAYEYPVFAMADAGDVSGTYTCTVTILGQERESTLVLDGYGTATYTFFDEDDGSTRVHEGPYTVDGNTVVMDFYSSTGAYLLYTYTFEIDPVEHTFTLISVE